MKEKTILDTLADAARARVEENKKKKPMEVLKKEAKSLAADTGFPFEKALAAPGISVIGEVKKASPSKGLIAVDFPYLEIAQQYERAGASAISVLTEPEYFLGSDDYLREIAREVSIPVLRKDFTVDEYQIYEAKILGASAVLLICAILSEKELGQFLKMAHSLGLSALVEAHDEEEVARALRAGARIIGVNNRNLKDFTVDVKNSVRLRALIPPEVLYVSESGIRGAEDVAVLYKNGTDAVLMAKKMGKTRVIAETGAGQHGVACATAAALLGLECEIFMGKEDTDRQALNVYRMKLLGAKVHPVTSGTQTLKDAVNETMREWTNRVSDTHYVLGSVMGPHPFPTIVRDFQSVIGREAKAQILEKEGKLPAAVLACVGGGSNAMGMFYEFIPEKKVALIGCEAAGKGIDTDKHAATMAKGTPGVFHGMKSYFCQDQYGQIAPVYSISAGLDYPGIGPEHAWLHDIGRASYVPVTDEEAVEAFEYLARTEGIICAIESAHAVAHARKLAPTLSSDQSIIICLSGRGDKDVAAIARYRGEDISE